MDLKKYFKKSELIPAVIQDVENGEVLMLAYMNEESLAKLWKQATRGSGAVPGKNCGTRGLPPVMFRKSLRSTATATMIPCLSRLSRPGRRATPETALAFSTE